MQRRLENSTNSRENWPYSSNGTIRLETLILVPNLLSMLLCSREDESHSKLLRIAIETWVGQITPTLKACFPSQRRIKTGARREGHRRLSRGHTWEAIRQVDSIWKMTTVCYLQFKINILLMKLQYKELEIIWHKLEANRCSTRTWFCPLDKTQMMNMLRLSTLTIEKSDHLQVITILSISMVQLCKTKETAQVILVWQSITRA